MAVYVDGAVWPWRGRMWCHLLADDLDELHAFAARLGLRREFFQQPPKARTPHYDLDADTRGRALALGAVPVDWRRMAALAKQLRARWHARAAASGEPVRTGTTPTPRPPG